MMEARAAEFAELCTGDEEVERAIDRWVWYAGFADKLAQVLGATNPVAGPYFNFTIPEPTGVVAVVAPDEPPLARPRLADRAGARRRQRRRRGRVRDAPARGGRARRGARDQRRPRRRRQHPHGPARRARALARSHMDVNAIDLTGADGLGARARARGRREREARRRAAAPTPEPVRDLGVPRAEDRLAPDRCLECGCEAHSATFGS